MTALLAAALLTGCASLPEMHELTDEVAIATAELAAVVSHALDPEPGDAEPAAVAADPGHRGAQKRPSIPLAVHKTPASQPTTVGPPPPAYSREGSRREVRDWAALDASVRRLPRPASMEELARSLSALGRDEWERTRALHVWLTQNIAYDTASFFSGRIPPQTPESVFRSGAAVCAGYAELFARVGTLMGLNVRVVSGYAKGYGYRAGTRFTGTNHAWNAVYLAGSWHLFDATWGAGHINGRAFVRSYTDFWFDPPPELMLRTHLPERSEWQLVERPITLREFEAHAHIPSHALTGLFELGTPDARVIQALDSGDGLPAADRPRHPAVRVTSVPIRATLRAGQPYHFNLSLPPGAEAAVINNSTWHRLVASDDRWTVSVTPARGELQLAVRTDPASRNYWTVLQYRVE